ncbi:MAG: XRE family transcriptional regulator [Alphaproteobacteria bacterium]
MSSLAERVAQARTAKAWSQSELARQVSLRRAALGKPEVKQQSINQLEAGGVDSPRYLIELADALDVDVGWLSGRDPEPVPELGRSRTGIVEAPLISWVAAGELADTTDPYVPGDAEKWIPVAHRHGSVIALRVQGNSMNQIAQEGATIIVDLNDRSLSDGRHYVFRHEGRATFKTYRLGPPERLEPRSTDPDYLPIYPDSDIEVVGRVIQKVEEI